MKFTQNEHDEDEEDEDEDHADEVEDTVEICASTSWRFPSIYSLNSIYIYIYIYFIGFLSLYIYK